MKISGYIILLILILLPSIPPALGAERFVFDKAQTIITFFASSLDLLDITGTFDDYDGSLLFNEIHPDESQVNIVLRSSGIRTSNRALDSMLRGKHWFNSDQFPEIRFVSTKVLVTGSKTALMVGNLTLRGRTKPIVFAVRFESVSGSDKRSFEATATIKLSDFDLAYFPALVVKNVQLFVHAVAVK